MKSSSLEEKVISILNENKIRFEREKTFPNLKNIIIIYVLIFIFPKGIVVLKYKARSIINLSVPFIKIDKIYLNNKSMIDLRLVGV